MLQFEADGDEMDPIQIAEVALAGSQDELKSEGGGVCGCSPRAS
jgi:hypothetical protein